MKRMIITYLTLIKKKYAQPIQIFFCVVSCLGFPDWLYAYEYIFDRMWPIYQQEWYFYEPSDVVIDAFGYVYIANQKNDCILKFTSDGKFVARWGKTGEKEGGFVDPFGITADRNGYVYVTDMKNNRVQKFDSNGTFICSWNGYEMNSFKCPMGIVADNNYIIVQLWFFQTCDVDVRVSQ